ncbi:hypothetical protein D3C86_1572640 [compost metagenome]
MKTNNSMKLLLIPCLILMLSLSALHGKAETKTATFTDPYVWTTIEWVFTDLDGIEYQDIWVDFFDSPGSPVTVYGITLNYYVEITPTNHIFNMSQVLSGSSFYLLEDNAVYRIPGGTGSPSVYHNYYLSPGTGYQIY